MAEADTALAALDSAFNTIAPSLPRSTKLANQQVIDLIRAQRYVRDRQFATAIPLLRRVTSSGVEDKNQAASNQYLQSLWLLANVYAAIGQWDQSAAVYQQVATLRPNEVVAQEATANSWMSAGTLFSTRAELAQFALPLARPGLGRISTASPRADGPAQLGSLPARFDSSRTT
jgi:tetratricopeptide (TPR) repeat protein